MLEFRTCKHWVLSTLRCECSERVAEVSLPAVVPVGVLSGWRTKYWGVEVANGLRACCLFQPVVCHYLSLCPQNGISVCFGELYVNSRFVSYLGLLSTASVCWASWVSCVFATWRVMSGLTSSSVVLKVCLRDVYNNYVDACGFSVFVSAALRACYGNFEGLRTLLDMLSANAIDSNKRQFYAVSRSQHSKLVRFYSLICDEFSPHCKRRLSDLAVLKLLKCASFVPLHKLSLLKKLLSLDLDLVSTLALFKDAPKYTRAWLSLKRFRDSMSALNLEIKHVCWLSEDAKTESNLLFQFSSAAVNATGESYKLGNNVVTSSVLTYND